MDSPAPSSAPIVVWQRKMSQRVQVLLDRSTPHVAGRWIALVVMALLYTIRVWYLRGFYIITYGLGIYNLNLVRAAGSGDTLGAVDAPWLLTSGHLRRRWASSRRNSTLSRKGPCCLLTRSKSSSRSCGGCQSSSSGGHLQCKRQPACMG